MKRLWNYTQESRKAGTKQQIPCCCLEARFTGKPRCFGVPVSLLESPSNEFWRTLHSHAEPATALGTRGRARSRIPRTFQNAIQLLAASGSWLDLWGCIPEENLEGAAEGCLYRLELCVFLGVSLEERSCCMWMSLLRLLYCRMPSSICLCSKSLLGFGGTFSLYR